MKLDLGEEFGICLDKIFLKDKNFNEVISGY
jgi:hypothetical protein